MRVFTGRSTSAAISALLAGVALPASAQEAPSTEPVPTGGLQEIVVTAERRTQSLQDVPISATVLTGDTILQRGVTGVNDLQQVAPSVAINTFNRSTFINIRGVGIAQSAPTSSPGVAFYIDGQLIPHEQFIGQSFYDIASIEVLRGPQGTLSGQNSTGGAIYVRTPAPEYDTVSGMVDATYGNYDALKLVGAINLSGSEQFAVRIAGIRDRRDSFTKNIGPSESNPGNLDLWGVRLNAAMRNTDQTLSANVRVDWFKSVSDNNAVKRRGDTVSSDPFVIQEDARSFQNQDGYRLSFEPRIALTPDIDLRTQVSYQNMHTIDQTDGDRSATARPRPPASNTGRVSLVSTDFDTFMAEVNLLSSQKGKFNWVLGAFYLDEDVLTFSRRDNNHTTDFVSSTSTFKTLAHNTTKSAFGQANWFVTDALELVAGLRYSEDQQVYNRIIPAGTVPPGADTTGVQKSRKWTGKLGVNYHIDRTLLYATASQGYKAGGVNLTIGVPNFGPETNRVYEAGFKTTLLGNRLRVNGDVFYSDYQDIQFSSLLDTLPLTQNAASGKAYGGELEVTGQFGGFGINAGVGYLKAEFAEDTCITDTNQSGTDAGCPTNLRFVPKGRALPFSPEWTINAGAQYDFEVGTVTVTPRVQWSHLSQQVATPFPSANTIVPGRDVFDARLTVDFDGAYKLEGFVNNFTNKTYIASQIQNSSSADGGSIYGAPRTYGIRAVAKF
ncbi:MAG: TonB-dependent receptor [Novosphingobium sp.]|nr:TonB-dependent receptor [Novosphingobium sp.]